MFLQPVDHHFIFLDPVYMIPGMKRKRHGMKRNLNQLDLETASCIQLKAVQLHTGMIN